MEIGDEKRSRFLTRRAENLIAQQELSSEFREADQVRMRFLNIFLVYVKINSKSTFLSHHSIAVK